jgi:protein tyrosine/serine phosphatase
MVACLLGAAFWLWEEVLEYHVIPKRWTAVEPGAIYRSGQLTATLVKQTLARHKIAVIIALNGDAPDNRDQQAELAAAEELGIRHMRFPLSGDGTGELANYARALEELVRAKRAGQPVLVHCSAGVMRTGGVIAFYRLLVEKRPASFVMKEFRRHWWDPDDTDILEYINEHIAELAATLQQHGVIESIPDPLPVLPI